jgi:3-oxoacyl-[acyl-carrier protein] reductase
MYDFSEQTVVVTGGTRGIGRAVSTAFLDSGATVIANYANNDNAAEDFKNTAGERLHLSKFDVADAGAVESFFRDFQETHGALHVLVNSAGIRRDSVLAMMSPENWQMVLDVNLTGTYNMCKFAVQVMMGEKYGRIVNVTSPCGRFGFEGQANYAASKAGIVAMTRSLSKEVAKRKITANCVSPGFVSTELIDDLPPALAEEYRNSVPMKRFAEPSEIAHAVLFLAAREAGYVTGATLEITGGL